MDEFRDARLQEVQAKLKPVLQELGLTARLRISFVGTTIEFANEDRSILSPVRILLARRAKEQHDRPWVGSGLLFANCEEIEIGDTGWKYLRERAGGFPSQFGDDENETFAQIREAIQEEELVRVGESHPDLTCDDTFAEDYRLVQILANKVNAGPMRCERVGNHMSYVFESEDGAEWRLAYMEDEIVLSIDGETHDTVRRYQPGVKELVENAIRHHGGSKPRF